MARSPGPRYPDNIDCPCVHESLGRVIRRDTYPSLPSFDTADSAYGIYNLIGDKV